ncbi:MAG: hypothetical protein O3A95_10345 [Planctomycetota bacterium]|nr:hypothetical protein [Planctomycetota bacterium]MDA1114683.1 hypothetical protein [Planctomycetota bacterium]
MASQDAMRLLQSRLNQPNCPCVGMIADLQMHYDLRVPKEERHLWSPSLSGHFEDLADGGSVLHGLIGPNPNAWTAIAFSYLACGTGILFLLTLGGVQLFLDKNPWAFWAILVPLIVMFFAWFAAQAGQKVAAPQTASLRHFLEDTFHMSEAEHLRTDQDPYHG